MPAITLSRVSFGYTSSTPLFEDVDVQLDRGWTGLVGPNGAGKTTLLCLLSGAFEPDSGSIHAQPADLRVRLCPQRVEQQSDGIDRLAEALDGVAQRVRGELRLERGDLERWGTLSPGERKRWQVGAALAAEPGLLLLDEPTNHLDAEARALLTRALRQFDGIGVLVSHDRDFLNALTESTLRCFAGQVRLYRGSYARARSSWEHEERARDDAYERIKGEERKLRRRLQDRREKRSRMQRSRRTTPLAAGAREHDASSSFRSARRRSPAISLAREMKVLGGAIDRTAEKREAFSFDRELGSSLFVDYQPAPASVLLGLKTDSLEVPGRVLLEGIDVQVRRESRIRVTGPNGAGKTTLLRALVEAGRVPQERLLHLPQELDASQETALMDEVQRLSLDDRGRVLTVVAALGVDPERLLASRRPSPGEARKLMLAFGLGRRVWGLLLDKPTNHMDLPSVERLETALGAYPGALVLVTHDETFARACTASEWRLAGRRIEVR
jgi:ATPase subunit of ABC transporter with duplicated ATPase domains